MTPAQRIHPHALLMRVALGGKGGREPPMLEALKWPPGGSKNISAQRGPKSVADLLTIEINYFRGTKLNGR